MEKIADANLRAYIVWLPVLRSGAHEPAARREAGRIPDSRAVRFNDPEARVGKLYSVILHLPPGLPAWDVYLVFGAEARWDENPPAPAYWMHQLAKAGPPPLRLDGEQLARVISGLLAAAAKQSPPTARSTNATRSTPLTAASGAFLRNGVVRPPPVPYASDGGVAESFRSVPGR